MGSISIGSECSGRHCFFFFCNYKAGLRYRSMLESTSAIYQSSSTYGQISFERSLIILTKTRLARLRKGGVSYITVIYCV